MRMISSLKHFSSRWLGGVVTCLLLFTSQLPAQDILGGLMGAGGPEGGGAFVSFKSDGSAYTVQKAFTNLGSDFSSGLVQAPDGSLYGTAQSGGKYNAGVIFKLLPGEVTPSVIYQFDPRATGFRPGTSLTVGSDGYLYGTCMYGGPANGYGTVFKVQPDGSNYSTLHSFSNYSEDGAVPLAPLTEGSDGYLYGITSWGGQHGKGTLVRIKTDGNAFLVLHHLNTADGTDARSSLVEGPGGYFYGAAPQGGNFDKGTLFKIKADGSSFAVIRHCTVDTEGGHPVGGLVLVSDGYFYGMTGWAGSIFRVNADGSNFSVLHRFNFNVEGTQPTGSLSPGKHGSLYGMTTQGGNYNQGTVFKMNVGQGAVTVLRHLNPASDGVNPLGYFTEGSEGDLYGVSLENKLFKIGLPSGSLAPMGALGGKDGYAPQGDLERGLDGYLYGVTSKGGLHNYGTVFKLKPDGSDFRVIRHLNLPDGTTPHGGLTQGRDGYLYGMAHGGGSFGFGTLFRIQPDGSNFSVIKHLDWQKGGYGRSQLVENKNGYFYGVIIQGGPTGNGIVFSMKPDGSSFTILHAFNRDTEGAFPMGKLLEGADGNYYGVTSVGGLYSNGAYGGGTIFRISTQGQFQVLHHFNPSADGERPEDGLVKGKDGYLYGVTSTGAQFAGGIFKIREDGSGFLVLKRLNGSEGAGPVQNLVEGSDGSLYGMAAQGGVQVQGTLFRINPTGSDFSVLKYLNSPTDGAWGSLLLLKAAPRISTIPPQTLQQDSSSVLHFSVEPVPTDTSTFTITVTTDNQVLLPNGSILVAGSGADRTLTIQPARGKTGQAKVTLTVTDWKAVKQTEFLVKVEAPIVAALEQQEPTRQVRIVPNPTRGAFSLSLWEDLHGPVHVQLLSPLGQVVKEFFFKEANGVISLNLSDQLPGVYTLKITTAKQGWTGKVVKH